MSAGWRWRVLIGRQPHLPFAVPRKYYDLFPRETIQLPPYKKDDLDDIPPAGV